LIKELEKELVLQSSVVREGSEQFRVTIPLEWVIALGWQKGEKLKARLVLGSSQLIVSEGD